MSNLGWTEFDILNANVLYVNGQPFTNYISNLIAEDNLEQGEIDEIKAFLARLDLQITAPNTLTITNENRNSVLKTAIDALNTKTNYLDTTALTTSWIITDTNKNAALKTRIDGNDTSLGLLNTKTQYITSEVGEGAIIPGGAAVAPSYVTLNPGATSNTEWNQVNLIANSSTSFIKICDDTTIGTGAGRDEIQIKNNSLVRIESSQLSLLGSTTNVGTSSSSIMFPSLTITQPISISGLVFGYVTGSAPAFLVAKILAAAVLPNYTDIFGFETALLSRDKKVVTTNKPVVKDLTLYNLDAANVFPVESTYIANGSIAKSCLVGNQNYYVGNGAWETRVDDFGNIGSMTLNDKENKTNKIKVSNQNVEIRSNNGSSGNIVLHNGCPSGAIQFRKGNDNTDATSNAAMEIITPSNALSHLCSQVIIGADTRALVAQTGVYDNKSKLIVDTTQFAFTSTGKTGVHGIQVSDNFSSNNTTYVDAANVSSKSLTLQDNYTGTTTKTLYTDANANLMFNGQSVAMGTITTPTLAQVLVAGNTAGSTALNMNSQDVTNAATLGATTINATTVNATTLVPTNITGWNVKSIVAGTNVTVSNASGAVTINASAPATGNDADVGFVVSNACALPSKPFWYNTNSSWIYNSSNVQTGDNYVDNCVSNTGQYQLIVSSDRVRYSVDWGVTWGNTSFTTFSLTSICITGSGNRYYFNGIYRVFFFDATYSTFGSSGNYLTSFPTLSGSLNYTRMKCSQDGKFILIGGSGGNGTIYQSSDYGVTSTQQNTQGSSINIDDVAMSSDGKYQFLMFRQTGGTAGRVMYSLNYGVTFNSPTMPNTYSLTLLRVACSASGQYVTTINQSIGVLISSDYGKTYIYSSGSVGTPLDCCMSANGQFQLVVDNNGVWFSGDYGRSFLQYSSTLSGATPSLKTIACSATGGYATVAGDSGRSWDIYDVPDDVRQLAAGSNVSISNNGSGTYTIGVSMGGLVSYPITSYSAVYNSYGGTVARATFSGMSVNLTTHRIHGVLQMGTDDGFDYPLLIFNNKNLTAGVNTSSTASQPDEFAQDFNLTHGGQYATGAAGSAYYHQDFSQTFCDRVLPYGDGAWILKFTIDLQRRQDGNENGYMLCTGEYNYTQRISAMNPRPYYSYYGTFVRGTNITSITSIGIQGFFTNNSIRYATINLNIEPLPPYIYNGAATI